MRVELGVLVRRINRKLRRDDQMLKKARSERARLDLGDFYILNFNRNIVVARHVDPVGLARELGVLDADEVVSE